ncbi:MAG: hypothetical protein RLZZ70_447 [Candidatus Parcubacteria bacterium]
MPQLNIYGEMAELVEGSGLENRQGRKPLEGSNPSLSARLKYHC